MLKDEVKKDNNAATTTIRSAGRTEEDHTQCFSKTLHKGDIRIQANYKQPPPATQCTFCACFDFSKQHGLFNSVITNASFEYGFFGIACRQKKVWFTGHQGILTLHFRVCFVSAVCVCVREWKKDQLQQVR